jgi:hypothetical protein
MYNRVVLFLHDFVLFLHDFVLFLFDVLIDKKLLSYNLTINKKVSGYF